MAYGMKGLQDVEVVETRICYIDGIKGVLQYRGHSIDKLIERDYEEVTHLLLYGELPDQARRDEFRAQIRAERPIHVEVENSLHFCNPNLDAMDALRTALALCDRVVVPVPPSQADIWSTQRFVRLVQSVEREAPPEIIGFINRGDTHHAVRETNEAAAALVSLPDIRYIKPRLSQRTVYRRSFSEGLAVFELESRGKGAKEFYALAAALFPHFLS